MDSMDSARHSTVNDRQSTNPLDNMLFVFVANPESACTNGKIETWRWISRAISIERICYFGVIYDTLECTIIWLDDVIFSQDEFCLLRLNWLLLP